jgi:hypothetical protein
MPESHVDWAERKPVVAASPLALADINHPFVTDLLCGLVSVFGRNGKAKNHAIQALFTAAQLFTRT